MAGLVDEPATVLIHPDHVRPAAFGVDESRPWAAVGPSLPGQIEDREEPALGRAGDLRAHPPGQPERVPAVDRWRYWPRRWFALQPQHHLRVGLEPARGEYHPAASSDLECPSASGGYHAGDLGALAQQANDSTSAYQSHPGISTAAQQADHQRLAHAHQPGVGALDVQLLGLQSAADQVEPSHLVVGEDHRERRRPHQVLEIAQVADLDRFGLEVPADLAALGHRERVGDPRSCGEPERRVLLEQSSHPRRGPQERLDRSGVAPDRVPPAVVQRLLEGVGYAGLGHPMIGRDPYLGAGDRGGAAPPLGSLQDQDFCTGDRRGKRRTQPGAAGAHDDNVHLAVRHFVSLGRRSPESPRPISGPHAKNRTLRPIPALHAGCPLRTVPVSDVAFETAVGPRCYWVPRVTWAVCGELSPRV